LFTWRVHCYRGDGCENVVGSWQQENVGQAGSAENFKWICGIRLRCRVYFLSSRIALLSYNQEG